MGSDSWIPQHIKDRLLWLLDHRIVVGTMLLSTLYSLYISDITRLTLPKSADLTIYMLLLLVVVLFAAELVAATIARDGFVFGFFWW